MYGPDDLVRCGAPLISAPFGGLWRLAEASDGGRQSVRMAGWHRGVGLPYAAALALIMAASAGLRLYGIWSLPLNYDEGATDYFAHAALCDLWGPPARLETNPPLFYTLEHFVVQAIGADAGALRMGSVWAGLLCVPVAALIALRIAGRPASLAAAALVGTSAVNIVSSQDARCYAVCTLAALVAIAAELRLFEAHRITQPRGSQSSGGTWSIYILASITALYLHNTAVLMVAALNLVALMFWISSLEMQRRFAVRWIAANMLILAVYAIWLPVIAYQSVYTLANFWLAVPSLTDLRYAIMSVYAQPYISWLQPLPDAIFVLAGLAGVIAYRSNRALLGLASFVLLVVPATSWLISQWRPIMNGKTLLWLAPVFLIFVALGCTRVRRLAVPLTVLLVAIQAIACYGYFQTRWDEAFPEVASILRETALDGDIIYLDPASEEVLLNYYDWPRAKLEVYARSGPPWFRGFDGTWLADIGAGPFDRSRRVWVLTRANRAEHLALAGKLSPTMTEVIDRSFGHGLWRNTPLQNLELSLFIPKPD